MFSYYFLTDKKVGIEFRKEERQPLYYELQGIQYDGGKWLGLFD